MTPFEIEILFHYYSRSGDHESMSDPDCLIWRQTIDGFKANGMLADKGANDACYEITDKGRAWCDYVCSLPTPKCIWTMEKS